MVFSTKNHKSTLQDQFISLVIKILIFKVNGKTYFSTDLK